MVIASPLLEAKLYVPHARRSLVARPRLSERLSRGVESKLILVSAPAGFGKTTLLAEWLAATPADELSRAWVSLDHGDNDPASFWTYVVGALQTVEPGIGASAIALLQSPTPSPIVAVLAPLLNELGTLPKDVVLVLDDYHVIGARDIQDGMVFLVDHLPPQVHLLIATRADPALPLARLRARGELVEIRAADLRFTPDEAAAYLNETMGLALTARNVARLEERTEGWIAALQLAALSMQGRDDLGGFIAGFAGDDRYVVDYLVEEVLQRQPERTRSFLLQTCILDRLSGPLCDAVTGQDGGRAMLEGLERGNLFVVPLDDRRQWYRYHHLFADVLHTRLLDERPDRVVDLHRRASAWWEQSGERPAAISHSLAGRDFERAADLVELAAPEARRNRQEATLLEWLTSLPNEVIRVRPVLSIHYVGALLVRGRLDGVEVHLRNAERWLSPTAPSTEMVVVDQEAFRGLPGWVAVYRAAQALAQGDVPNTVAFARRAFDLMPEDDHLGHGAAASLLGLASWSSGDLEAAHRAYAAGMAGIQRAGHIADALGCALALADIRIAQGRLREAMRTLERALMLATERRAPGLRGTADMLIGMSELHLQHGDLEAARQHLLRSQQLGEGAGLPQSPYRWRVAMAGIRQAEGDPESALVLLDEAGRLYVSDYFPMVRPVAALKARVWIAHGRFGEALSWARDRGLSADDDLTYLHEFDHITLCRLLLARSRSERGDRSLREAFGLLERLLHAADEGERTASVIEILVLQALAHQMHADIPAALVALERALILSEPESYVRIFVDEGPPMATLLEEAANRGVSPSYVRRLLTAFDVGVASAPVRSALVEPLSERELDVLRLLATDLSGPHIASELMVSLNTLRTHTKKIFAKLGVNNRRAAVRRARELDLFTPARQH
jgi:LuxR family transcriptional regulator, maltose regulon positive regulatory protein